MKSSINYGNDNNTKNRIRAFKEIGRVGLGFNKAILLKPV